MNDRDSKKTIREMLKSRLDQIPFEDLIEKSGRLNSLFQNEIARCFRENLPQNHIVSFVPFDNEPQINIESEEKNEPYRVSYVRISSWTERKMIPAIARRDQPGEWEEIEIAPGKKIYQPGAWQGICSANEISAILVPGLGFSQGGDRIGRGAGFYDRFLNEYPSALRIGIAFEEQLISSFPTDSWDEKVDVILTDSGFSRILDMKSFGEWKTQGKIRNRQQS